MIEGSTAAAFRIIANAHPLAASGPYDHRGGRRARALSCLASGEGVCSGITAGPPLPNPRCMNRSTAATRLESVLIAGAVPTQGAAATAKMDSAPEREREALAKSTQPIRHATPLQGRTRQKATMVARSEPPARESRPVPMTRWWAGEETPVPQAFRASCTTNNEHAWPTSARWRSRPATTPR